MNSRLYPFLAIGIAIISIQTGAAFAKQLFPVVGPIGITALRLSIATTLLMALWRPWRQRLNALHVKVALFYGLSLAGMNLSFYLAIERIPLGLGVALEFSGPLSLAILASRKATDFLWALMALLGIAFIAPITETSSVDPLGVFFALLAAAFWGLYITFGHRAAHIMHAGHATAWGMAIATLAIFPAVLLSKAYSVITLDIIPQAFLVALLSSAIPYSLEMLALKRVPKLTFGILMSLEPAMAALAGLFMLGEQLSFTEWTAIGLIMGASLGATLVVPLKSQSPVGKTNC